MYLELGLAVIVTVDIDALRFQEASLVQTKHAMVRALPFVVVGLIAVIFIATVSLSIRPSVPEPYATTDGESGTIRVENDKSKLSLWFFRNWMSILSWFQVLHIIMAL